MTYASPDPARDGAAQTPEPSAPRRGLGCALEIVETLVLTLVIYLLIHNFIAQPFEVEQNSMVPTIMEGEYVLIDKVSPRFSDYERGDIVVFNPPSGYSEGGVPFIKRVIGLPGDTVRLETGKVVVTPPGGVANGARRALRQHGHKASARADAVRETLKGTRQWTVPAGSYFVMGDNRSVSQDSRVFGPIARNLIIGRAWLRYFPLNRIGFVERPTYEGLPSVPASPTPSAGALEPLGLLAGG